MNPNVRHACRGRNTSRRRQGLAAAIAVSLAFAGQPRANAQSIEPEGWRSEEFLRDWGLAAIGADHAYARGLTGRGIRLGVFDSGTALGHPDFAGKHHLSLRIGDLLADGSRCANTTLLAGPDVCFASDGDEITRDHVRFHPDVPQHIRDIIMQGGYTRPGIYYNSHGTHVAGTIAANRDGQGTHGVAFDSGLVVAKLFFDSAREWRLDTDGYYRILPLAGVRADASAFVDLYTQMNAHGVGALNHSWGLSSEPNTPALMDFYLSHPSFRLQLDAIGGGSHARGMLQVWAAGNTVRPNASPDSAPIAGMYATLPRERPDLEPYWVSVVNLGKDLGLSPRSNRCGLSANWCIAAPGTDITSTVYDDGSPSQGELVLRPDGNLELRPGVHLPSLGYADMSGTSMAAPHVTGALGLLFERFPYLSGAQVRDVMLTTATDLGAPGVDDIYGWGLLNLRKAIDGPGQLRVDTEVVMDRGAGGIRTWQGGAWDDWRNDIGGQGHLTKAGTGWLRLSGNNAFGGATVREGLLELTGTNRLGALKVHGGALQLSGTLDATDLHVQTGLAVVDGRVIGGRTRVGPEGLLAGNGQLGDTRVEGVIAPGDGIGTLRVQGDYVQVEGSTYVAEVQPPGASDLLHVSGRAELQGGTLRVVRRPGVFSLGQHYRVLQADGGLSGQFTRVDQEAMSPFLKFSALYAMDGVHIDVARGEPLSAYARTPNQHAAAVAADALPIFQGLPQPLAELFPESAMAALEQLDGEIYPTSQAVLIAAASRVRDSALARARVGQDAFTAQADDDAAHGAWVEILRMGGTLDGDSNAAGARYDGHANLVGVDHRFGGWRIGVLGGVGRADLNVGARGSRARVDSRQAGVYVGKAWNGFGLRAGHLQAWHDMDTSRRIAFTGLSDSAASSHDVRIRQTFIEAGYRMGSGAWQWEPIAQFARLRAWGDTFVEGGGPAALQGRMDKADVDLAAVGARFDISLRGARQEQGWLNLQGVVIHQRTHGDEISSAQVAWAQGTTFTVQGAPLGHHATRVDLGVSARTSRNGLLAFGYQGQFGDGAHHHGLNARWSLQF